MRRRTGYDTCHHKLEGRFQTVNSEPSATYATEAHARQTPPSVPHANKRRSNLTFESLEAIGKNATADHITNAGRHQLPPRSIGPLRKLSQHHEEGLDAYIAHYSCPITGPLTRV
ncbi:hypothetical protein ACKLNR_013093 [Fusarium oxysporum f. sp. zingiberi]